MVSSTYTALITNAFSNPLEKNWNMIPKTIHYCWFGGKPLPKSACKCIDSWRRYLPDHTIQEWNESNFDVNMVPYTTEAYAARKYAFVSDFARFWILHEYGGVYFDTDVEVIRPMDDILAQGAFMGMENRTSVNPGLGLAVGKKHPLYTWYINYFSDKHFAPGQPSMIPVLREKLLSMGWKQERRIQTIGDITIYPPDFFCPQAMKGAPIHLTENTRSIHHFDASWMPWYTQWRIAIIAWFRSLFSR